MEWRQTGHVWMSWVLGLSCSVLVFPAASIAPQSRSFHHACLFYQFIPFHFIVHLNQYIFATEITWNWSFLVQRGKKLLSFNWYKGEKNQNKSLFSQRMWRKRGCHFFQFFTPISKWRWLQFVIAPFISRSTVRRSAPVFFYTHWFSIICLELFLVILSQQRVLLKNLSLRRLCFFLFYVQFHLQSASKAFLDACSFSLLLCNCSIFLTPLIFLSLLHYFPLSHFAPTPPSSLSCWGEDLPLLHHPPHKAGSVPWIPSILTKAAFVSASFCIYFMHLSLRSLGKLNSMYESPCFHEVPE